MRWVRKICDKSIPVHYVMEATGTYYELLAYHLDKIKKQVSVVLANKVNHYIKSLNIKTKTDVSDARAISLLGAERNLALWKPPHPLFKELRSLTRLYRTLLADKTMANNRLKQLECAYEPLKLALKVHRASIKRIDKQLNSIVNHMEKLLRSDSAIWSKVEKLLTIKGIGLKTVALVLGETQGFQQIVNQRQLTSYCGYDVVKRESGTSINGRTKISKKGNSHIRASLHFPAMVATRFNPKMKQIYQRLLAKKKSKKTALVAIQRRLLVLMYALWKTDRSYCEKYDPKEVIELVGSDAKKVDDGINPPSTQNESQEILLEVQNSSFSSKDT